MLKRLSTSNTGSRTNTYSNTEFENNRKVNENFSYFEKRIIELEKRIIELEKNYQQQT